MLMRTVIVPVADMRSEPNHRSERVSQALYGSSVTVKDEREQFCLAQTDDDYEGWIARSYLKEMNEPSSVVRFVSSRFAWFGLPDSRALVLPFGAQVSAETENGQFVDMQSEMLMNLVSGALDEAVQQPGLLPVDVAMGLVSSPYLWGGASPYGYDCSGFVQAVFRRCGVMLPRDSREQCGCGDEVLWAESRAGDLVCFPGHVALHLGNRDIIHATRLRGMVVVESLDPRATAFRADLIDKITSVRRVLS
jgi:hypothetical protein